MLLVFLIIGWSSVVFFRFFLAASGYFSNKILFAVEWTVGFAAELLKMMHRAVTQTPKNCFSVQCLLGKIFCCQ